MQPSLEQYVAQRYVHELNETGYQAVCQNATEMLEDALTIMASLNRATQFIKSGMTQRQAQAL